MKNRKLSSYAPAEELANCLIHGLGTAIAITGLVLLAIRSRGFLGGRPAGALETISSVLFAATMICMFLASTLYHAVQHKELKRVLRIVDHSAIYLLIAGTYTPFCLIALKGAWGWTLFGLEWAIALAGIIIHARGVKSLKKFEIAAYIIMGWAIVASWFRLMEALSLRTLVFLVAGGVLYTLGVFWYRKKNVVGTHAVWHVFVLAGAACHWASVWTMLAE
jgi:hemolysin III